ncbi:MAG: RNA methyltransferase [Anaerolineae bacterium]|mgnify:FL=1|jgi:TrmH family RNA methyltransferase|nr:RNA methyltransferase [Anaerolineae bacterium]MBT4458166.1 RNA methyltransferase [Anaerolineae bacterium]MBT6062650.1 RNA methyltransferase [Anaerolineae bacterium]MBT6322029.1 RNA methyltransferase [Anaerolineae bacterium]
MIEKETLNSRNNPLIKQLRSLNRRKSRTETGLFLVEGIHHIGVAIEADWDVNTIIYVPELLKSEYARDLISASTKKGIRCQSASPDIFRSLAGKENPQGILAAIQQRDFSLSALINFQRGAAIVAPQDPGNLGTILRTLDAVGADGLLLLDGGVDLYHSKAVRASMGALFWKPVVRTSFDDFLAWTKENTHKVIGTSARGRSDLKSLNLDNESWVLLLGSEQKGLSPKQISACDTLISLPMRGHGTSLNLAVAAGVLLYGLME